MEMKYPYNRNNRNYDGNWHYIEPSSLVEIGDSLFFLDYLDKTLDKINGKKMYTFLVKTNDGHFVKVPLKAYDTFEVSKIISKIKVQMILNSNFREKAIKKAKELEAEGRINCTEIKTIEDLISGKVKEDIEKKTRAIGVYSSDFPPAKVATKIFYNLADGKYYWDPECTKPIGDISSLGELSSDGKTIQGNGFMDYIIVRVNINKVTAAIPPTPPTPPTPPVPPKIPHFGGWIYYNELDKKYYYDEECTRPIRNITSWMKEWGNVILSPDFVEYRIKKVNINTSALHHSPASVSEVEEKKDYFKYWRLYTQKTNTLLEPIFEKFLTDIQGSTKEKLREIISEFWKNITAIEKKYRYYYEILEPIDDLKKDYDKLFDDFHQIFDDSSENYPGYLKFAIKAVITDYNNGEYDNSNTNTRGSR